MLEINLLNSTNEIAPKKPSPGLVWLLAMTILSLVAFFIWHYNLSTHEKDSSETMSMSLNDIHFVGFLKNPNGLFAILKMADGSVTYVQKGDQLSHELNIIDITERNILVQKNNEKFVIQ